MTPPTRTELLISVIADLLADCGHVAVGASSPIPGSGALLARKLSGDKLRVSILGSRRNNFFTNGGVELFDLAAQGRIDAFFLGGGQIDGEGNINLVGSGDYPHSDVRWPGSFGSAYLYFMVPRVILFREEHTPRVMVPKVDFISAPGGSDVNVYRPGGATHLLTGLGLFSFDRSRRRFTLESAHVGSSAEEITAQTGFTFDQNNPVSVTPAPSDGRLKMIRGDIRAEVAEVYPRFAASSQFA